MARSRRSPRPRVPASPRPSPGRGETVPKLDRTIHERMRLAIVSALAASETLSFAELKSLLATTDGNLSVHARKLEDAGYVSCRKTFAGRMPKTQYRLTPEGRRAFERYLAHLEALVHAGRGAGGGKRGPEPKERRKKFGHLLCVAKPVRSMLPLLEKSAPAFALTLAGEAKASGPKEG